jgi:probable HAF family extracellular repeat protein
MSATKLTAQINASDIATAGNANITVVDPGTNGGASTAVKFTINSAPIQGTLALTITGLPAGTPGSVTVTGPNGYSSQFTSSQSLQLAPGTYTVVGNPVGAAGSTYYPATASQTETVSSTAPASVTVDYATIVPNTTKVLDAIGMQSLAVSPNGSTITISTASIVANSLAVGDVLASAPTTAAPNGLLVKILSLSTSGQTVTASVQQATLEEAIQQGTIQFSQVLGPANTTPSRTNRRKFFSRSARGPLKPKSSSSATSPCTGNPNTLPVPFPVSQGESTTLDGQADFCPTFNFSLQIMAFKLVSANATITFGSDLSLSLEDDNGQGSLTQNLPGLVGDPTLVLVGGVPIELQPTLTPFIGMSFPFNADNSSAYTGVFLTATETVGTSYSNGSWKPIGQASASASPTSETSAEGQVNVKALAGLQVGILIDGIVSDYVSTDGYLQFIASPNANPCWNLNAGLEATVGVQADILGVGLGYSSPNLNITSIPVAQATNTCAPMLSSINPNMALAMSPDTPIALSGSNFVPNSVANFNGQALATTFIDPNDLTAIVPSSDLVSGGTFPVTVTNPGNPSVTSKPVIFTVSAVIVTVAPPSASVPVGKTQQFTATVQGTTNTAVSWSVNGTPGGNSTVGTITSEGLYTAPTTVPTPAAVSVSATSQAQSNVKASATVTVTTSNYNFTEIKDPAANAGTELYGINNNGEIVGSYKVSTTNGYQTHGLLYNNGMFTAIDYPPPNNTPFQDTELNGINDSEQIVGFSDYGTSAIYGYLYSNGNFTALGYSGASATYPWGINDSSQVVGTYEIPNDGYGSHGFLYSDGNFTTINYPGSVFSTQASAINNNGQIVGTYVYSNDSNQYEHGFLYSNGQFTAIDYPGATETMPQGVNDSGQIVGQYVVNGNGHAFLYSNGQFTTIDDPAAQYSDEAYGINNNGQIVGTYADSEGGMHSYLATPN